MAYLAWKMSNRHVPAWKKKLDDLIVKKNRKFGWGGEEGNQIGGNFKHPGNEREKVELGDLSVKRK